MLDALGVVGSPADLATLVVVLAKFHSDVGPKLDVLGAGVVALAQGRRDVDHERLMHDLDIDETAVNAVRPTIADGEGDDGGR